MSKRASSRPNPPRRGGVLLVAVVALAIVAVVMAAITWQCLAARRLVEHRQQQLQAEWLARAGVELAADRLLTDPAGYRGESVEPIPGAWVRIEVRADPAAADVFRVTSEARFPADGRGAVLRSATRSFRRTTRDKQVRLEVVSESR
jgi:hypothetical protein